MTTYEIITNEIISQLENGVRPWVKPFNGGYVSLPLRSNGVPYQGINILLLWLQNKTQPIWMTYNQASQLGGQVRKGEKATKITYYGTASDKEDETKSFSFIKTYPVFNVEQISGLPKQYYHEPQEEYRNPSQLCNSVIKWIELTNAVFQTGDRACYYPTRDIVEMPKWEDFRSGNDYYSALYHEFTHWTGHESRLDRLGQANKKEYAFEELVAEMGAAFLMAQFGFEPTVREDHAQYINHWLTALHNDKKFIFQAATAATKAVEYLNTTINNNTMKEAV